MTSERVISLLKKDIVTCLKIPGKYLLCLDQKSNFEVIVALLLLRYYTKTFVMEMVVGTIIYLGYPVYQTIKKVFIATF